MRNLRVFSGPGEIHDYFIGIWKTDYFRTEHAREGSMLQMVMQQVARYPLFVYDMSEHPPGPLPPREKTEAKHFSPWWGGIIRYDYAHPVVHDTCWLHDLAHRALMQYAPAENVASFSAKMLRLERQATIASSMAPYLDAWELRAQIDESLLVDRFMDDGQFMMRWHLAREAAWAELDDFLVESVQLPHPQDGLRSQVHQYGQINQAWLTIWEPRYGEVEQQMAQLHARIDAGVAWADAMAPWQAWLQAACAGTEIPFFREAEAFSQHYMALHPTRG